uniref:Uncharacterized protein n=1 Tax=Oryza sativa subsp. japonica TaxID=39947 RepID=Q6YY79_ORYSJ|nr:hypothetical protein [Oryza sativa Japonica Group]
MLAWTEVLQTVSSPLKHTYFWMLLLTEEEGKEGSAHSPAGAAGAENREIWSTHTRYGWIRGSQG